MKRAAVILLGSIVLLGTHASANAAGDPVAGEGVFKKNCARCHRVEDGKDMTGPWLFGVYGRQAGSTASKRYKGLVGADFVWDESSLDTYLLDPVAFTQEKTGKRSSMVGIKLPEAQDRADVIAYLKTLK